MFYISKLFDDDDDYACGSLLGNRGGRECKILLEGHPGNGVGYWVCVVCDDSSEFSLVLSLEFVLHLGFVNQHSAFGVCDIFRFGVRRQGGCRGLSQNFAVIVWLFRIKIPIGVEFIFCSNF